MTGSRARVQSCPGTVAASLAKARKAPNKPCARELYASPTHSWLSRIRGARRRDGAAVHFAWDIAGRCDIRAMTYVINSHLRRHDTYRNWFECTEGNHLRRRTMPQAADIELVPTSMAR